MQHGNSVKAINDRFNTNFEANTAAPRRVLDGSEEDFERAPGNFDASKVKNCFLSSSSVDPLTEYQTYLADSFSYSISLLIQKMPHLLIRADIVNRRDPLLHITSSMIASIFELSVQLI